MSTPTKDTVVTQDDATTVDPVVLPVPPKDPAVEGDECTGSCVETPKP
jgi:hypothetical protein